MATLADKDKVLEILAEAPDGMALADIVNRLGKSTAVTSTLLSRWKTEGMAINPEAGIWQLTDAGRRKVGIGVETKPAKPVEEPGSIMKPNAEIEEILSMSIPGEYDKFMQIGRSLGIKEDFLRVASDHVFTGDVHNLNHIWDSLNELYLRPDVTRRWFNTWSRVINLPIPPEIAKEVMPKTTEAAREAEAKVPTRFTLVGDEIVADPEGEFTFSQARQYLMTKAIQGAAPQLGGEKVSEIIGAISPFMLQQQTARVAELEKQGETSVLATLVKSLIESKGGNAQQPLTLADVITVVDKIDEARRSAAAAVAAGTSKQLSGFEEMERIVNLFDKMRGLFGSKESTVSPITVAIKGSDGQVGAVPLETFFQIEDHRRQVRREDEELEDKRDMGKTIRGFLDKISKAAHNVASR